MLDAADRQINRERDGADRLIDRAACLAPGGENSPSRKALSLSLDPPSTYRINRPRACLFPDIDSVLILVLLFFFSRERKVERGYLASTCIVKTTTMVAEKPAFYRTIINAKFSGRPSGDPKPPHGCIYPSIQSAIPSHPSHPIPSRREEDMENSCRRGCVPPVRASTSKTRPACHR